MRAVGLCLLCIHAVEIKTVDEERKRGEPFWREEESCVLLRQRNLPGCAKGEEVFALDATCASFVEGTPKLVTSAFKPFLPIVPPAR